MRTQLEIQKENVQNLLKLIEENPELKILPMVETEVVADDGYRSWAGTFDKSEIDYIWMTEERIYFKSMDEEQLIEEAIDDICDEEDYETPGKRIEARAEQKVENYEWEKVIVVRITTPELEENK